MKQKLLLKVMLLLCALIAGSSSVWAAEQTIEVTIGTYAAAQNPAWVNESAYSSITINSDLTATSVTGGNNGKYYTSNSSWRHYEGNSGAVTITTTSGVLKSITFTYSSGNDGVFKYGDSEVESGVECEDVSGLTSATFTVAHSSGTKNGNVQLTKISVKYDPAAVVTPTCAAPSFSPASGAVVSGTTVTLSTTTEGATIHYTMGATPADPTASSPTYTAPIEITSATTIKAIAVKDGYNNSTVTRASYTIVTPLADISALTAKTEAGTYYVTLSDAVVTYVNGKYAYIQDASGAVVYYKDSHTLTAGNILNGTAIVSYTKNNSNPQITDLSGVTPTTGAAPDPTSVKQSEWAYTFNNVLSKYFQITRATITKTNSKYYVSLGGENVQLYKVGGGLSISDLTKKYTITGFPMLYNTTKELQIFAAPVEEVSTDPAIASTSSSLSGFTYEVDNGPSTTKTISVSGSNLTADISLSLGESNYEISLSEGSGYSNSLTLTQTAGAVAATTIYVRLKAGLAVNASYNGTITLTSAGADNVLVSLSGSVTPHSSSWDLSTASQISASEDLVTWASNYATMTLAKGTSSTAANNYLGDNSNNHTRFYKDQVLTFIPTAGYKIKYVEITGVTSYVAGFTGNTWTNASKSTSGATVTITPTNNTKAFSGKISAACRATAITVYYEEAASANIVITSAGWASFSCVKEVAIPAGVTAYYASASSGSSVTLKEIESGYIPANTGVVVAGSANTYEATVTNTGATLGETNLLKPWLTAGTPTEETYYTLAAGPTFKQSTGGILAAGKAYLVLPTSAPELNVIIGGTTGINEVRGQMEEVRGEYFNLNGQRVANPSKGLYIVNGKKVIVK